MFFEKCINIIRNSKLKNLYVSYMYVFYCNIILYTLNVVYYHGYRAGIYGNLGATIPEPSDIMKKEMGRRRLYLLIRRNMCVRSIDSLEPVASAIERDEWKEMNVMNIIIETFSYLKFLGNMCG